MHIFAIAVGQRVQLRSFGEALSGVVPRSPTAAGDRAHPAGAHREIGHQGLHDDRGAEGTSALGRVKLRC